MLLTMKASLPSQIDLYFKILDLSEGSKIFSDQESLSKISLLISRTYLKVLKLDLSSLSIAIIDQLFQILENSDCT